MLLDRLRENEKYCAGCTACSQICPVNAIKMTSDKEGFYFPQINNEICINCKKCERVCPQLNSVNHNTDSPECFAVMAEDEIRTISTSGGMFGILAQYIFSQGGYVCGAAFDKDFRGVSHIMISDSKDLYKLNGSKYVYSKMGDLFTLIKERLENQENVLFSGCPCQVAGLYNYLGKDYKNLFTVDLLCGGVPSEHVYSSFIDEVSGGKEIASVSFRPKELGWSCVKIKITFKDGSIFFKPNGDLYSKGFLNNLFKSHACKNCSFASTPRQADMTIGDFWKIERYFPDLDTDLGVSCLLLNNEKAKRIFKDIYNQFQWIKPVPLSFLKRFNQMAAKRTQHLGRERFFSLLDRGFPLSKAVNYSLEWIFDIALTGCWTVRNYGGELTYYAMYELLRDMGYTVIMVERRVDIHGYDVPKPVLFRKNPYPFYDVSRIHKNLNDQRELNTRVYNFILASDQVWNYKFMGEFVKSYSLDYVAEWRKKISYASSFGLTKFPGDDKQKQEFRSLIERFDYVSVREKSGVEIMRSEFGVNSEWVLDPVFLCNKKHYNQLLKNATVKMTGTYIFTYFMHLNSSKYGIEKLAQKWNLSLINTIDAGKTKIDADTSFLAQWPYPYEFNCKLEDWLYYLINSEFVITDSFHATCMAIIYAKPFVFVEGHLQEDRPGRIRSILGTLGLEDRIVNTVQEAIVQEKRFRELDYSFSYEVLEEEKIRCMEWLRRAIDMEKDR